MTPQAKWSLVEAAMLLALALGFVLFLRWRTGSWPWEDR